MEDGSKPHRILILGHSYVRRLHEFAQSSNQDKVTPSFGLPPDRFLVFFAGYGGAKIERIHRELEKDVTQFRPHVVILQVGSNDISNQCNDPQILADAIVKLAERVHVQYRVHKVVVSELFFRNKWRGGNFNGVTQEINCRLRETLPTHSKSAGLSLWRHFGFWDPLVRKTLQHPDLVHFNDEGNLKYFKSFRRAILKSF